MSTKLVFTAAAAVGGLLVGGIVAAIPAAAPSPLGSPKDKPAAHATAGSKAPAGTVILRPQTVGAPGVAPSNDDYADAQSAGSYKQFDLLVDNRDATVEKGENRAVSPYNVGYQIYNTVWVTWTAPASGTIEVDTTLTSPTLDTSLGVFTGSTLAKAKLLAKNDDTAATNYTSKIPALAVTKGTKYHFQIGSSERAGSTTTNDSSHTGSINFFLWETFTPPSNDSILHAVTMKGNDWTATGTTYGATIQNGTEPTDNPASSNQPRTDSIWYKWTATAGGTMTLGDGPVLAQSANYVAVFEQAQFGAFQQVAYHNGSASGAFTNLPVVAGSTYFFQLGETDGSDQGPRSLALHASLTGPIVKSISSKSGSHKGGKKLTITGSRMNNVSYVAWNGQLINTFTVSGTTKLTFTIPAGLKGQVVPIAVVDANGLVSAGNPAAFYHYTS